MEDYQDYKVAVTTSLMKSSLESLDKFKTKHGLKKTNKILDFLLKNIDAKLSEEDIALLKS